MAAAAADFDGRVIAVEGSLVTYRVLHVRMDDPAGVDRLPRSGGAVTVSYSGSTRQLHLDESYRVVGWADGPGRLTSRIAYDYQGDCGTDAGTTALDGSYLGTEGLDRYVPYGAAGVVVIVGGFLATRAVLARRRGRPWHYV